MKNYILAFLVLCTLQLNAQNPLIEGEWLLEQILNHKENKAESVYQILSFKSTGELLIQNYPFGQWSTDAKKNNLTINSKKIGGEYKITALNKTELELTLENKVLYFSKINREQIYRNNKESGLIGVWKLQVEKDHLRNLIEFKSPDEISFVEMDNSYKGRNSGAWIFKPKSKELIIIGQIKNLRGINEVISISNNEVDLKNNGSVYILKKVEQVQNKIERLTFTNEDFYTKDGDYKYKEDESKLPWNGFYTMLKSLMNIDKLSYQYSSLEENTNTFETKLLEAIVTTNFEKELFTIDNVFSGFDRNNLYEDQEFPENKYDGLKPLYPCLATTFRVIGEEEIKVPAGKFQCIVVEALNDSDTRLKIYMIKNQPGIIAKIISEKTGTFGHYAIYQLKEIITK